MTCDLIAPWLLFARTEAELSDEGREHIRGCAACRRRFGDLLSTDAAVRALSPRPTGVPRSLLARIERTPQAVPANRPYASRPRWLVPAALAACVIVGVAVGRWLLPSNGDGESVAESAPVLVYPPTPPPLLAVVAREVAVLSTASAGEQVAVFGRVAAAIRREALHRATTGAVDEVSPLIATHDRVVRSGLAATLMRFPEVQRAAAAERVAAELESAAGELTVEMGQVPPAIADPLRPLATQCASAAAALRRSPTDHALLLNGIGDTLLDALVIQAGGVANARQPIGRAEAASELAGSLARVLSVLAVSGRPEDAASVGESFDRVIAEGVEGNLTAPPVGSRPSDADARRVRERSATAVAVLERNLASAPPAARAGLERAISAAKGKAGKPTHPVKGFEKKTKGKGGVPPGWLKKQ